MPATTPATAGQIRIKTGGNIVNAVVNAGDVNLTGTDILLEAGKGHIGEVGNAVTIGHSAGGLIARAQDDIVIIAPTTDLRVESVYSQKGDVFLTATKARSSTPSAATASKIVARHISLSAINGSIGTLADYLDIDVTSPLAAAGSVLDQGNLGTIIAAAKGSIYLAETDGDMNLRGITSAQGDVGLKAVIGSIVDAEYAVPVVEIVDGVETFVVVRAGADIIANSVRLEALLGIGGPGQELEINSSRQADGKVNAFTKLGSIYLLETTGNLNLDQVGSGLAGLATTFTFLTAAHGSILNARSSSETDKRNVIASKTYLQASDDIGASGNRIVSGIAESRILVARRQHLCAQSRRHGAAAVSLKALSTRAQSGGSINIMASSPITVTTSNLAWTGDINIVADDDDETSGLGDDTGRSRHHRVRRRARSAARAASMSSPATTSISRTARSYRQAGDHHLRRLSRTSADDPDATGTTIKIEGDLQGRRPASPSAAAVRRDTIRIETTALLLGDTIDQGRRRRRYDRRRPHAVDDHLSGRGCRRRSMRTAFRTLPATAPAASCATS